MSQPTPHTDPRRSFLSRLGAGALALAAMPVLSRRAEAQPEAAVATEPWLSALAKAKHKQVFDAPEVNGGFPMMFSGAYLMTMNGTYKLKPGEAHVVLVMRHGGAVMALNDAMWSKYGLGKFANVTDAQTGAPSTRNIFFNSRAGDVLNPDWSLDKLPALGVTPVVCNLALNKLSERMAGAMGIKPEDAYAEWKANLVAGVQIAPSGVLAVGRAQEAGCTYCFAG
ncbi:MAG: hypothetical protein HY275_02620 [Gemmatimonadetes bacterium]|nr:hypothetical protein [Gemmatimonadota bacterium]